MASLTPDQLKRIEENRVAALKRRENKLNLLQGKTNQPPHSLSSPTSINYPQITNNFIGPQETKKKVTVDSKEKNINTFYHSEGKRKFTHEPENGAFPVKKMFAVSENSRSNTTFSKQKPLQTEISVNGNFSFLKTFNGSCELVSPTRFTVNVDYYQPLIEVLKTVCGRKYDTEKRQWNFPLTEYDKLLSKVNELKPQVNITPLPKFILKNFLSKSKSAEPFKNDSFKDIDISSIEPTIGKQLYPFQIEGVQFGISKNGRCLIADDMGLGKTIQAIGIADYFKSNWPLLIACPSSMRYQWEEDICRLLPNVPMHSIFVLKSSKDYIEESLVRVLILSYDLLGKLKTVLQSLKFGVIILDESHSLKSGSTQRSKSALDIVKKASQVILLSGTPALSRPVELYTQLAAIQPSFFGGFKEYAVRYCDTKLSRFGWDNSGSSHMDELKIVLESKFMIRRLKQDVLTQLPSKIRQVIVLNSDTIKGSKEMKGYHDSLSGGKLSHSDKRSQMMLYFAETGKSKVKAVCEHIENLIDEDKKFLCFAHHREVLDAICQALVKKKARYIRIDGKVHSDERKKMCDEFQYVDSCKAAVLSIKAANTGLTLTSAQLVVFAELFWNPGDLTQAEDRAHRIGQEDSVYVQYLLAKGSCDDFMWPLIEEKLTVLNKAGLTKDTFCNTANVTTPAASKPQNQPEITDFFKDELDADEDILNNIMDSFDGSNAI